MRKVTSPSLLQGYVSTSMAQGWQEPNLPPLLDQSISKALVGEAEHNGSYDVRLNARSPLGNLWRHPSPKTPTNQSSLVEEDYQGRHVLPLYKSPSPISESSQRHAEDLHNSQISMAPKSPQHSLHISSDSVKIIEQLKTQNIRQNNCLTQQNQQLSMQIQQFEYYVREKMELIERWNSQVIETLNSMKREEREEIQRNKIDALFARDMLPDSSYIGVDKNVCFMMPKLPISNINNLMLLDTNVKNLQYTAQFVSQLHGA